MSTTPTAVLVPLYIVTGYRKQQETIRLLRQKIATLRNEAKVAKATSELAVNKLQRENVLLRKDLSISQQQHKPEQAVLETFLRKQLSELRKR